MKARVAFLAFLIPVFSAAGQSLSEDPGRARLLFDQKKYGEAAVILERIQRAGRSAPADLILLGMCYTEMNELDKAASVLDQAAMVAPRSAALLNAQGNLAFVRKDYLGALGFFGEANQIDPQDPGARAGLVASLHNAAVLELGRNDAASAARHLRQALDIAPDDIGLLKLLFLALNALGDAKAMLPVLDRLIQVEPADPEPYAAKARLLEQQDRAKDAFGLFQQAVDKGSQDPLPFLRVGEAKRDRFLLHDAVGKAVHLISALQLEASQALSTVKGPDQLRGARLISTKIEDVRATLASSLSVLREIDGGSLFEEDLSRLQSWYPGSVDLTAAVGRLAEETGKWNEALTAWQHVLRDHPLDAEAQAGEGRAFEKLGNKDQAILAYRRARELRPDSRESYEALERLYAGKEAELVQILSDAAYRETRNALLFRELAKIEDGLGMKADADRHRARAGEIESGK